MNDIFHAPDKAAYLGENGWHFNKKAAMDAISHMYKKGIVTGKTEPIQPWTKEQVDEFLEKNGVKIENKIGYDYVYVANMAKADFLGKSLSDDKHVAMYIKDVVDDVDAPEGAIFACWYAKQILGRKPVDWGAYL